MDRAVAGSRLLVFCHLRWGFVWQRPQHLMTRLAAAGCSVRFVEEPEFHAGPPALRRRDEAGVTVLTPLLPVNAGFGRGFNPAVNAEIARLLAAEPDAGANVVWYQTPMALGAAPPAADGAIVVYDAMDELANFRGAPPELAAQEARLLAAADLVFTGGPSLYDRRKDANPRVFCFPSGVEAAHFAPDPSRPVPIDTATWQAPVLGFYGVLDERLDLDLVAAVADLRPDWLLVLIGPVIKIAEADLPRRPNIAYLGMRGYAELPAYLDRFDVAILPFAINDATAFISPTKTLEYLAAGKPVVSTPVRDVVRLYGEAVAIAATPAEFVIAAESQLAGLPPERRTAAAGLVAAHGWDEIAAAMADRIAERLAARRGRAPALSLAL